MLALYWWRLSVTQKGPVASALENLSQMPLPFRDRLPAPEPYVYAFVLMPVPERPGPHAGVYYPAGADREQGLGVGSAEAQALPGQSIYVGGLDPTIAVGSYVVFSEAVYDYQDDVGLVFLLS